GNWGAMDTRSGERRLNASHDVDAATRRVYATYIKPLLDRVLGLILLVLAIPLFIVVGLVVLIAMGRPLLYSHPRIGLRGTSFTLHKFRTMLPDRRRTREAFDGEERRANHKSPDDPRHTSVGRL